jgi:hypothetical protein
MYGNRASLTANRAVTLINDASYAGVLCNVNGLNIANRYDATIFEWYTDPATGKPAPGFPFFGFTVNLGPAINNRDMNTVVYRFTMNGRAYVVCDYGDTSFSFVSTEVTIFDVYGNLVAGPKSHDLLKADYTLKEVKSYMGLDSIENNLANMTLEEIARYYDIKLSGYPNLPDTLRPIYPETFTVGYDFMIKQGGPNATSIGVAAWNCLNAKGRLVAPGGYIAQQIIRAGSQVTVVTRKLIITSSQTNF